MSESKPYTFKTSVYTGDIIYTLPGIRQSCQKAGVKADIYFWLDRQFKPSYEGHNHPYGLNEYALSMMKPLLESQEYVNKVAEWKGENIAVDLDVLRTNSVTSMPYGSIMRWPFHIWPDMQCDLSKPWIDILVSLFPSEDRYGHKYLVHPVTMNKIVINRTSRWKNDMIHYFFLRDYAQELIFAGLPQEHEAFCKEWDIKIPLLEVTDFLDLAVALKSCRFFIGNQSLCFAIAEAMKIPRILEICPFAPNVIPTGADGYDFLHQFGFEYWFKELYSRFNK